MRHRTGVSQWARPCSCNAASSAAVRERSAAAIRATPHSLTCASAASAIANRQWVVTPPHRSGAHRRGRVLVPGRKCHWSPPSRACQCCSIDTPCSRHARRPQVGQPRRAEQPLVADRDDEIRLPAPDLRRQCAEALAEVETSAAPMPRAPAGRGRGRAAPPVAQYACGNASTRTAVSASSAASTVSVQSCPGSRAPEMRAPTSPPALLPWQQVDGNWPSSTSTASPPTTSGCARRSQPVGGRWHQRDRGPHRRRTNADARVRTLLDRRFPTPASEAPRRDAGVERACRCGLTARSRGRGAVSR